jgi:hypothetical protein
MKKLVLGALVAVASSVGCGSSGGTGGDVLVDVNWKFTQISDNTVLGCPAGFGTARIISQATDDTTHVGAGQQFMDKFDCAAGRGTISLPDDTYLIWVEIESNSGSSTYAQSQETFYDTLVDTGAVNAEIIDDGGFFYLEWDLFDANTHAAMSCAQAGIGASGAVEAISTGVSGTTMSADDQFTCTDHYGVTDPLIAGTYLVSVEAVDSTKHSIGNAPELTNQVIRAPGGFTNLGLVKIQISP